jgi:hypothetical protein
MTNDGHTMRPIIKLEGFVNYHLRKRERFLHAERK